MPIAGEVGGRLAAVLGSMVEHVQQAVPMHPLPLLATVRCIPYEKGYCVDRASASRTRRPGCGSACHAENHGYDWLGPSMVGRAASSPLPKPYLSAHLFFNPTIDTQPVFFSTDYLP